MNFSTYTALSIWTGIILAFTTVEGRYRHYYQHQCGSGRGCLVIPRRNYYYSRPGLSTTGFDADADFLKEMLSTPRVCANWNSLMRQHLASVQKLAENNYSSMVKIPSFFSPQYFVREHPGFNTIELVLDLPGVLPDDLSVQLEKDTKTIRIKGVRKEGKNVQYEFDQYFTIHEEWDKQRLKATFSSGVLRVTGLKKKKHVKNIPTITSNILEDVVIEKVKASSSHKEHQSSQVEDNTYELQIKQDDESTKAKQSRYEDQDTV